MFGFLRKKHQPKTAVPEEIPAVSGVFSTGLERFARSPTPVDYRDVYKRSIQRSAKEHVAAGAVVGMDSAAFGEYDSLKFGAGVNQTIPWTQMAWYASQGFIGYQNCGIIAQNWLVDKACTMPARDAARNGYEITVNDGTEVSPEILDFLRQKDKEYGIKEHVVEHVRKGRMFGFRISWPVIESPDKEYYEKPFNPDGIRPGSYKGMTQIDPFWITPELDQDAVTPGNKSFYIPTWWRINGQRYHRSHLIIMRNGSVADTLKPTYLYGGIPVPQRIAERVYAAERTANEAPMLALTKRLIGYKTDLSQAEANPEKFFKRIEGWVQFMNNYGVKVIGKDDDLIHYDTTLADLDAAIMTQYQLVAASSDVPATKLLGTSPKGFNASGDYEAKSYSQFLESIQEHDMTPVIDRHHLCVIRSDIVKKFSTNPFGTEIAWKPTDSPSAMEAADINLKKSQTDSSLVTSGAIDGTDVRNRLINDPESGYNGIDEIVPGGPGDREDEREIGEELKDRKKTEQ